MKDIKDQIKLIRKVRLIRNKYESTEDSKRHKNQVFVFLKKHHLLIIGTCILFVAQGIIETFLVFISKNKLSFSGNTLINQFFWQLFIGLIIIFIINSFFSIKQEKTVNVLFINSLRRRIFKNYLGKSVDDMSSEKQADLIAKISYHLPLVSMGISNSIFGIVRWLIYLISAIVVALLAGLNLTLIISIFLILSVIIAVSSYLVVKQYISQEVTFYSQIIKHIDLSLSEKYFSKNFNLEPAILKKFDNLVNFDSIFRIRRDLWMKMAFKIIFILLLVISVLTHLFYDSIAIQINLISPELKFLYLFLLVYLSRVVTESLRVGLYFFPAKLGFSLTNVKVEKYSHREDKIKINKELSFYSKKIKLFKTGKYYKDLKLTFKKAGRYLFYGSNLSGKTNLARIFFGHDFETSKALKVRIDGRRTHFPNYQKKFRDIYFFDPKFYSQKSLIEVVTGIGREEADFSNTDRALKIIGDHKMLADLISDSNNFSASAASIWSNNLSAFALHALHCLVTKPVVIIIDNLWLDLNYSDIDKILNIISSELPDSIIIVFAKNKLTNLKYDETYNMDKNFLCE
jgi:hypothetical protein